MAFPGIAGEGPFGFRITRGVKYLLLANTLLFLLTVAFGDIVFAYLGFRPVDVLRRPWTPFTYMFVHAGFGHFFFNMLALFFFGPPLEEHWGTRDFAKVYLLAGLAGAALSLLFPTSLTVGASGAIYGLLAAYAYLWPDNLIYFWGIFPIKAKWFVSGLVAVSVLMSMSNPLSGVAHLAHLGGAAAGFLAVKTRFVPGRWGRTRSATWRPNGGNTARVVERARAMVRRQRGPTTTLRAEKTAATPDRKDIVRERQLLDDVDRILEKISAHGIASLSKEELERLSEASRRGQTN